MFQREQQRDLKKKRYLFRKYVDEAGRSEKERRCCQAYHSEKFLKEWICPYFGQQKRMKKLAMILCTALLGLGIYVSPALAANVTATLPTFPVTLNGISMQQSHSQYPLIVYKDITYVPMTWHDCRLLGLESEWNKQTGLVISKSGNADASKYKPYKQNAANAQKQTASIATGKITVNGKKINNASEPYPLLVFRDVTYFPLTWRFAVDEFGWDYHFDKKTGLTIAPKTGGSSNNGIVGKQIVVTGTVVNLRNNPGTNGTQSIAQAKQGDVFTVSAVKKVDGKDWYQITMKNGQKAWIASWLTKEKTQNPVTPPKPTPQPQPQPQPQTPVDQSVVGKNVVVTGSTVNIRNNPGTNGTKVIGQVYNGNIFKVVGVKSVNGEIWYQIKTANGNAWIASWLVSVTNAQPSAQTAASIQSVSQNGGKTVITIKHGKNNTYKTTGSGITSLTMLLNNNNIANGSQMSRNLSSGPVRGILLQESGQNVKLSLTLQKGAYCTVKPSGDNVIITAYNQHGPGESGLHGKTIVIDPGHGGSDPGAVGKYITDAEVGLAVGQRLQKSLEAQGARVLMTRTSPDQRVGLIPRSDMANNNEADLFISIHGNSASNKNAKGIQVYYYAPEGNANLYAQKYIRNNFAQKVASGMYNATGTGSSVRTANYSVLRENDRPSILVETGFLSNPEEGKKLADPKYQDKLAQGIYNGVVNYFAQY